MKTTLTSFFLFIVCFSTLYAERYHARAIGIYDLKQERYLHQKNIFTKRAPASTIKVLTALTAWKESPNVKAYVRVSKRATLAQPTKAYLKEGEYYRIDDLIKTCLVASCNDAARALAEGIAGSEYAFAQKMQRLAEQLGTRQTKVTNASGLPRPSGMTISINDSIKILKATIKIPELVKMLKVKSFNLTSKKGRKIPLRNHNRLLNGFEFEVIGKTGYTKLARHCFLSYGKSKKHEVIISILGNEKKFLWNDLRAGYRLHLDREAYMPRFLKNNKISLAKLHQLLKNKGFPVKKHETYYGPETRKAVKRFQIENRLSVDGIVGPQTWGVLGK